MREISIPNKNLLINIYINMRKIDLANVNAYDESRIVKIEVLVKIKASNVPWF